MKRLFRYLALTLIVISCFITAAHAADSYFELNGFVFEIDSQNKAVIHDYDGRAADVVIPDDLIGAKVVRIEDYAFFNQTGVSSVSFDQASELSSIGSSAFYGCTGLSELSLPAQTELSFASFQNCTGLRSLQLGEGITTIPSQGFYGCSSLDQVTIPSSVTEIGSRAFAECTGLTFVYMPDTDMTISDNAFDNDSALIFRCDSDDCDAAQYARDHGIPVEYSFSYMRGDADGDRYITILDVTMIQRFLGHIIPDPDGMIGLCGSVTNDVLEITDATAIQRYIASFRQNPYRVGEEDIGYRAETAS